MRWLTLLLLAATLSAAEKPNFSGRWRLGGEYIDVDHRDPVLIVQAGKETRFLGTDGVDRTDVARTVARWDGRAIEVRTGNPPRVERFELSGDGKQLTVTSDGTARTYERADLRAGLATADITPSAFLPMYGYANRRCGPANGSHDPLMAKAMVLESGPSRVAIVTMDLGSFVSARLVADLKRDLRLDAVLLAA